MKKALAVARWEFVEKVKSKAFLISLILMPLIMIAFGVLPGLLATRADSSARTIGVIDATGDFLTPLSRIIEQRYRLPDGQPNYVLRALLPEGSPDIQEAKRVADLLVQGEDIEGYVIITDSTVQSGVAEYRSGNVGNVRLVDRLQEAIRDVITEKKLHRYGLASDVMKDLTLPVEMRTIRISESGKEERSGFLEIFFSAYVFVMMMFFLVITSGQLLVRSMLEEKSNRIVEVLMSSCSPMDLMIGKIVGLSGLGLAQIAFWALIGITLSVKFSVATIPATNALLLLPYFVFGYLFYAALFVAAGAPVSTEQEAQQITSYVIMVLMVPVMFAISVMQDPDAPLIKILSFIPLLTPTMMAVRIPIQLPSTGEIVGTMVTLALSAGAMMWVAGKIFRTTILMTGKRPGVRDLIRFLGTK
jgi:ABC-2 type transport system permease protein